MFSVGGEFYFALTEASSYLLKILFIVLTYFSQNSQLQITKPHLSSPEECSAGVAGDGPIVSPSLGGGDVTDHAPSAHDVKVFLFKIINTYEITNLNVKWNGWNGKFKQKS